MIMRGAFTRRLKKLSAVVLSFGIIASAFTVRAAVGENLIANADLEGAYTVPANNPYNLGISTEESHSGTHSLKTRVQSSWGHLVHFTTTEPLVAGKKYCFSVWYKVPEVFNSSTRVNVVGNDGAAAHIFGSANAADSQQKVVMGKWAKYSVTFTALENAPNYAYMYTCLVAVGNATEGFGANTYAYFDDFNLREVPDGTVNLLSASAENTNVKGAEVKFDFDSEMDIFSIKDNLKLNGKELNGADVSVNCEDGIYSYTVKINKTLVPLADYTLSFSDAEDMCGRQLADESAAVSFKTKSYITADAEYYVVTDGSEKKADKLSGDADVKGRFTLYNNTDSDILCYIVNVLTENGNIVKVLSAVPVNVKVGENAEEYTTTEPWSVGEGQSIKSFYWTSLKADLRALTSYTELSQEG